jgi:HEAT repeat protein
LASADHPAHDALMSMLRVSRLPVARLRSLEWAHIDAASRACVARLARSDSRLDMEMVLGAAHLAMRPSRARGVAELGGGACEVGRASEASRLTIGARRMLARWSAACGADAPSRERCVLALLHDEDALTRAACVAHAPTGPLLDLAMDEDARVSRSALLAWLDAGEATAKVWRGDSRRDVLSVLARMPHESVREITRIELRTGTGEVCAGRSWERRDPGAFVESLRVALRVEEETERVRAITSARRAGVVDALEGALREAHDAPGASERVRASVVAALGDARTPVLRDLLVGALRDDDARVRANAVESLAKRARRQGAGHSRVELKPMLREHGDSRAHHRERANSVRAWIEGCGDEPGAGAEGLLSMLRDDRAEHRLAASWLAMRVLPAHGPLRLDPLWAELTAVVGESARFDAEPGVRARSARCAALVESSMSAWGGSGAEGAA